MDADELRDAIAAGILRFCAGWERIAGSAELVARAVERDKGAKTKAGNKPNTNLPSIQGFIKKYYPKNDHGFYNFYIDDKKFGTKNSDIGEIAKDAYEQDAEVFVYYKMKIDGKYTNYYPESIEIVDPLKKQRPRAAPEMPADEVATQEEVEETPF